jgi:hypothetical protein
MPNPTDADTAFVRAVQEAVMVATSFFALAAVNAGLEWRDPHVVVTEEEASLEWWADGRKLSLYIDADSVTAFKIQGEAIVEEVVFHADLIGLYFIGLWRWFITGAA